MTILIVENSLLVSSRIKNLLAETSTCNSIFQSVGHSKAPALFEEIQTDVLLLDMYLPQNMSFRLLEKIKSAPFVTTIVALVNREDFEKQAKCREIGVNFIVDKYHDFEKIPGIIDFIASTKNQNNLDEQPAQHPELA